MSQAKVRIIEASKESRGKVSKPVPGKKLRVAAYCRVSTSLEEQESSYETQCSYYREKILSNPEWELAGIFSDEGITGTSMAKRPGFCSMLEAAREGKIDLILTKSLSRYSRNTLDILSTVRQLKGLGVGIFFEKENIHTLTAEGETILSLMAAISQSESESISRNVRVGIRMMFEGGGFMVNTSRFLGYTKGPEGRLLIDPAEAAVVRRIYRAYLEGYAITRIARELQEDGLPTGGGGAFWYDPTVKYILTNEKYQGDILSQKWYTKDALSRKPMKNTGELRRYYSQDRHDPVIPRDVFLYVQQELALSRHCSRRSRRYGSRQALGGRLLCPVCRRPMRRYERAGDGSVWKCSAHRQVALESRVKEGILEVLNGLPGRQEEVEELCRSLRREHALMKEKILARTREEAEPGRETQELEQKASDCLQRLMQADALLHLLEGVKGGLSEAEPSCDLTPEQASAREASRNLEEFLARSEYMPQRGPLESFVDRQVIRYVDQVQLKEGSLAVHLRAGLSLEAPLAWEAGDSRKERDRRKGKGQEAGVSS